MDSVRNPYSPGAGRMPAAFVGRDAELQAWDVGLQRGARGRSVRPLALYGLRGVGKTVLLNRMRREAEDAGWVTAKIEAGAGKTLREALGESLYGPLSDLARPSSGARLLRALRTALSFKASYDSNGNWNFGVDLSDTSGGGADSGVLEPDLVKLVRDLSAATAEEGTGLAVLIDEAQDLSHEELVALSAVAHQGSQENWPFLLALAGLPSLPRGLTEANSYAERLYEYHHVTALPHAEAVTALVVPAQEEEAEWADDAVSFVLAETHAYPYFLQQYGQEAWNRSPGPCITVTDAEVGAAHAGAELDRGFFYSRWDRATRAERDYLRAMAKDGDNGSASGEVARRLGKELRAVGPVRHNLIKKGLIFAPDHGRVAFTVPRMADFISRQPED